MVPLLMIEKLTWPALIVVGTATLHSVRAIDWASACADDEAADAVGEGNGDGLEPGPAQAVAMMIVATRGRTAIRI